MPRFSRAPLLALLALVPVACDDAPDRLLGPDAPAAGVRAAPGITVMSQNLYLGANLDLLLTAQAPADVAMVFQQLTITSAADFGRAARLAMQIAERSPHLVGLQEVTTYSFTMPQGTVTLDFLFVLQQYLDYFHAVGLTPHTYAAVRNDLTTVDFDASIFGPFPNVTYADADAILVRDDVELVGEPERGVYDAFEVFSVAGTTFDNIRGWLAVTARVEGQLLRFGNTHLEVQRFEETQLRQTMELVEAFEDETLPVVLVGDFNSAANHDAPDDQKTDSYHLFRSAGYADLWLREAHSVGGYTCCQGATLTNPVSELGQRLDLVLARWGSAGFGGASTMEVVGEEPSDRITVTDPALGQLTLWPSDHAGVAATLWPAPGLRGRVADD